MRFHDLLDGFADICEADIDSSLFDALVGSFFHSGQQIIINRIEGHCECAVDDLTVDLGAEINFHHVIVAQNCLVARVWSIMSSTVVDAASRRKGYSLCQPIRLHQSSVCLLNLLAYVNQFDTWFYYGLGHLPHLPMTLSRPSQIIDLIIAKLILISIFLLSGPFSVKITWMIHELALRIFVIICLELVQN